MTMRRRPRRLRQPPACARDLNGCASMNDHDAQERSPCRTVRHGAHLPAPVMPRCAPQKLLAGQKALVTGASSGIGTRDRARARRGRRRRRRQLRRRRGQARAGRRARSRRAAAAPSRMRADVSSEDAGRRRCSRAMHAELGTIDILVNNAGLQQDAPFEEMTLAQWNKVIGVNLTGQFLCAREAVREFKRRGVRPEVSCARRQDHLHQLGPRGDSRGRAT